MTKKNDRANESFYSKVMLFGEYSIIYGSMALTIPYSHFQGSLMFMNDNHYTDLDFARRSNRQLLKYYEEHLRPSFKRDKFSSKLNLSAIKKDIDKGMYFESTIPEGYGLGSSGALVAALYHKYAKKNKFATRSTNSRDGILSLKQDFAMLESWFHGTSSGIDPLICYLQKPLLIKEDQSIHPIEIPHYNVTDDDAIFLVNSGKPVKTAPLVDQFVKNCEEPAYRDKIFNEYIPLNNRCIESLTTANIHQFTQDIHQLSLFQINNFEPMIPKSLEEEWIYGVESGEYMLKLCGSGGGGFILGFTHHYQKAKKMFEKKKIDIIPIYQYKGE